MHKNDECLINTQVTKLFLGLNLSKASQCIYQFDSVDEVKPNLLFWIENEIQT